MSPTVRICVLIVLFAAEAITATVLLDGASPIASPSALTTIIRTWGPGTARFAVAFSALFATFVFLRYQALLKSLTKTISRDPVRVSLLTIHAGAIAVFALASLRIYANRFVALDPNLAAIAWILAAAAAIVCAALAFFPWRFWRGLIHATGFLWLYVAVADALTWGATSALRSAWKPASIVTFHLVQFFLTPFATQVIAQPDRLRIGTSRFSVIITDECSGLEGIGLLLVFAILWLVLFRDEARLPQALILLPLSVVTLFLLNAVRIAALILIGNAGARDIAVHGFHSQAGWMAFNAVAFGSCMLARRWSWVSNAPARPHAATVEAPDATAAFLVPFLAILAAGMIARAGSGSFEWLYPIRVFAALAALWIYRRSYSRLDFRFGLPAVLTGVAVFALWIAADRIWGASASMPGALARSSAPLRDAWIALRIAGAVFTVPLAEELAFRGFVLRRLTGADFDSVPFQKTTWIAIAASSLLFGLMHGGRWLPGSIAGVAYAIVAKRGGRFGEAVVAHALTNALICVSVLFFEQWQLW